MAADQHQSPGFIVSDACISLTEALLKCRASVVTVGDANSIGQNLYTWFKGVGAIADDKAPFAKRSIALGILTLQNNSVETVEGVLDLIKDTFQHYTSP